MLSLHDALPIDNVHQDSFRSSLLGEPFDGVRNTTIFDYLEADERPAGIYLYATTPGIVPFADPHLAAYVAGQRAAGARAAYSDLRGGGYDNRKVWGITNDTQNTLGAVTIRNIRSEEQKSELQSHMRISYAVC